MDAAEYVVALIDKVSGPAHDASVAMSRLEKQIKKTGRVASAQGHMTGGIGPISPAELARINRANLALYAQSKLLKPIGRKVADGVDAGLAKLTTIAKYGAIAIAGAGSAAAAYAVKATVHMGMFAEKTRLAFGLLTGDQAVGEKTFTRTIELSRMLGMDVEDTAHSMQKLLAMQFAPQDAEKWIKLGADLRAVGVDASALQRVMLDIAHVKATGKLQMRNLNMFANAGVSSQLLMEEVGKAMGTDEAGAMKAMHAGKVTSAIALPALERAIMRKTHEHVAGEAGEQFANKTLSGLIEQLKNAPSLFFLKMADKAKGAIDKLKPLVDAVYKAIDSIQGDEFVRFIGVALEGVTKMVPLALEFAKGFGEGFSSIVDAMGEIDPAKASMQTARDLGHAIADGFSVALKVLKEIAEMLIWFDQHRTTAELAAGALGITRLLGAGTVAKGLWKGGKLLAKGGGALAGLAGFGARAAATTAAVPVAAAAGEQLGLNFAGNAATQLALPFAGQAAGGAAASAVGTSGAAALAAGIATWAGTSVAAASVGAIAAAILPGLLALGAGIYWREEIAKFMLGKAPEEATHRGLDASDIPAPTPVLTGMQRAAAGAQQRGTTNVQLHTTVNIDGKDKDAAELGRDVGEHQRGVLEQFFQSQALEQGAM